MSGICSPPSQGRSKEHTESRSTSPLESSSIRQEFQQSGSMGIDLYRLDYKTIFTIALKIVFFLFISIGSLIEQLRITVLHPFTQTGGGLMPGAAPTTPGNLSSNIITRMSNRDEFSFDTQRQPQSPRHNNVANYEKSLLSQTPFDIYSFAAPVPASIRKHPSPELPITKELKEAYNTAISVPGTLYEGLAVSLLFHLYNDRVDRNRLIHWKMMLYFDQLRSSLLKGIVLPVQYQAINYETMKGCLAKVFSVLEIATSKPSTSESDSSLLALLNSHPLYILSISICLKALVEKLSERYGLELEAYSTQSLTEEPEIDILWLISEFFNVNINLLFMEGSLMREEVFKPQEMTIQGICLIVDMKAGRHIYLRDCVDWVDVKHNHIRLYNSGSSVGEILELAELRDDRSKDTEKEEIQVINDGNVSEIIEDHQVVPESEGILLKGLKQVDVVLERDEDNIKTKRKAKKKSSCRRMRQRFQDQLKEIKQSSSKVFEKGQVLLSKVENLVEMNSPQARFRISGTVSLSIPPPQ